MKFRSGFLVGLGAGYVLGARAGQERYQQIVDATKSLRENPGVQRLTGEVNQTVAVGKDRVSEAASRRAEQAGDAAAQASKAKDAAASIGKKAEDKTATGGTPSETVSTTSASSGSRPTGKP